MRELSRPALILLVSVCLLISACGRPVRDDATVHIVRKGETLYSIAWRYGKDPDDVARWNRLGNGSLIYPGQVLSLVPKSTAANRRPKPLPTLPSEPPPAWGWPVTGKVSVEFGGKPGTGTGILIDGRSGQPIHAAAPGRVVYAGKGLIGYGELIIIKHNETYLSAYGYNRSILVKEGQTIARGQRIATMGEGPERKARLHFEIRRNGQPVNPRQFLPTR